MTPPHTTGRDGPDRLTQVLRAVSAAGLLTIAAIAAIVSYTHIHDVVLAHGETPTAAALIPLSVDGLILVASTTTLADRRAGRPRSHLATAALTLGAGASLAANIAHAQPTLTGRAVAAWSPIALALGHELLLRHLHTNQPQTSARNGTDRPRLHLVPVIGNTNAASQGRPSKKAQLAALVAELGSDDPRTTYQLARDLAPRIDLHEGTARRYLADLKPGSEPL
jgi:branched-subunit amino acid ABC-type transport system permease component